VTGTLRFRASARVKIRTETKARDVTGEKRVAIAEAITRDRVLDVVVGCIGGVDVGRAQEADEEAVIEYMGWGVRDRQSACNKSARENAINGARKRMRWRRQSRGVRGRNTIISENSTFESPCREGELVRWRWIARVCERQSVTLRENRRHDVRAAEFGVDAGRRALVAPRNHNQVPNN
jgi:hypothetical protein